MQNNVCCSTSLVKRAIRCRSSILNLDIQASSLWKREVISFNGMPAKMAMIGIRTHARVNRKYYRCAEIEDAII